MNNIIQFLAPGQDLSVAYLSTYSVPLVTLSVLTAVFASFMAFELSGRIAHAATAVGKMVWLVPGALALGGGVWAMHFIGMLALSLPCGISYDPLTTLASMVPGVLASAAALWVIGRTDISFGKLRLGAVLMGGGIGTMHYSGMAAMRLDAVIYYSPAIFALSIGFAVVLAFLSLYAKFVLQSQRDSFPEWARSVIGSSFMGVAISGMHYIAMEAAYFIPIDARLGIVPGISPTVLAIGIGVTTLMLVALTLAGSILGRHLETISVLKREIREREYAEQEIRKLSYAVEQSSASVVITSANGIIEYVNRKFVEVTGYSAEEAIGQNPRILKSGHTSPEEYEVLWQTITSGKEWHGEFHNKRKDGSLYWESAAISPIKAADGKITNYIALKDDITERKRSEEALRESEGKYRKASQIAKLGYWVWDEIEDKCIHCSDELAEIYGVSVDEYLLRSSSLESDLEWWHPEDRDHYEKVIRRAVDECTGYEVVFRIVRDDGEVRWLHEFTEAVLDDDGHIIQTVGILRDVTEEKIFEEQIRRSQKMEAVGQLTGGIAHDFNNILGIIIGNLEILRRMVSSDEKALGRVEMAFKGATRGADLTRKLLGFSRKETHETKPTSVNELIRNMEDLLIKSLTVAIKIEHRLADTLWQTKVDPGDFQDSLLNLALNAHDAMPDGGTLVIETANKVLDDGYVRRNPQGKAGEFVMLLVSDTGYGMTPEVRERVLEPFFSTKEEGQGTGLGLSMVFGFVQRSRGHMKVYSEPGQGTTIRIYLPRAHEEGANEVRKEAEAEAALPHGSETILVVDDEEGLVDIAVSHLEGLGYRTVTAYSAKQALRILEDNQDIDLLFSDVIMPGGMDGYQLAITAQKARPSLKALLSSGFTKKKEEYFSPDGSKYAELASELLSKPYNQAELATAIRRTLDEEG